MLTQLRLLNNFLRYFLLDSMISSLSKRFNQCALLFAAAALCVGAQAQTSFELQELNMTLQVAAQKIQTLETALAASKDKNAALAQKFARDMARHAPQAEEVSVLGPAPAPSRCRSAGR